MGRKIVRIVRCHGFMVARADPAAFRVITMGHFIKRYPADPVVGCIFNRIRERSVTLRANGELARYVPADIAVLIPENKIQNNPVNLTECFAHLLNRFGLYHVNNAGC